MTDIALGCSAPEFEDRYLGRESVAKFLDISERSVDRLASNDPTFPRPRKIGRSPKWPRHELIEWMEKRKS